jgi:translin
MSRLEEIGEVIIGYLEQKNQARDSALQLSRAIIRNCAIAIKSVHRNETAAATAHLEQAKEKVEELKQTLKPYPDLYHAGYSRDALKEFVEASIVQSVISGATLPSPEDLQVEIAAYLGGMGEAVGELRRRLLDALRQDSLDEAEQLMERMEDFYGFLVTVDFPDAITGRLRRITDVDRGIIERTRGDLVASIRQTALRQALEAIENKISK